MIRRILNVFEPFILALAGTVVLASLLPPSERWASVVATASQAGIVLLFFLHGAKLSRAAVIGGLRNWRLHLAVLAITFLFFPALGLLFARVPGLDPALAGGLLFLTLLPSTVQSSIAFTSIAGGDIAAAVCSASFFNLTGIVLTPLLVALLMSAPGGGGMGAGGAVAAVESIVYLLFLPFVIGHLSQSWTGAFVTRHKAMIGKVDRGAILLVVYSAFGSAVREGIWRRTSLSDLGLLFILCTAMLVIALLVSWYAAKALRLSRADVIVMLFCGSKKSLASGGPMAGLLFPAAVVGIVILPLMLLHQIQLIACAWIAKALARRAESGNPAATPVKTGEIRPVEL